MMTKLDKMLIGAVLLCAVVLFFGANLLFSPQGEASIVIELNGRHYAGYRLAELTAPKELVIETEKGKNVLTLSKNGAAMAETDCKDQECLTEITRPGQSIICLPHKLVVRIEGNSEVVAVAY